MIIMEMASEFIQAYRAAKAPRERNHTKRMDSTVINCAAILDDSGFFDVPRGRNNPSVVLAGTRHGDYAKGEHFAQVLHCLVVTEGTNRSIKRCEIPARFASLFHATWLTRQIVGVNSWQGQPIVDIQICDAGVRCKSQLTMTSSKDMKERVIKASIGITHRPLDLVPTPNVCRNSRD